MATLKEWDPMDVKLLVSRWLSHDATSFGDPLQLGQHGRNRCGSLPKPPSRPTTAPCLGRRRNITRQFVSWSAFTKNTDSGSLKHFISSQQLHELPVQAPAEIKCFVLTPLMEARDLASQNLQVCHTFRTEISLKAQILNETLCFGTDEIFSQLPIRGKKK